MNWHKSGAILIVVWLSQTCTNDQRLLDFLNGLDICSKSQKLTPEQAAKAKIVEGKWGHLVIYPAIAVSTSTAQTQ